MAKATKASKNIKRTSSTRSRVIESDETRQKGSFFTKKKIGILIAILVFLGLIYFLKGLFIVATVNNQPIYRISFTQELQRQAGSQVLNQLITKILIEQEAQKQKATVTDKDIDDEINKVKKQLETSGQNFDQTLSAQGLTMAQLRDQVKIQLLINKMLGKNIKVSDKEITDYIEKNKELLPENTKPADLNAQVKDQLFQQKLSEAFKPWLDKLQSQAKINYFVNF